MKYTDFFIGGRQVAISRSASKPAIYLAKAKLPGAYKANAAREFPDGQLAEGSVIITFSDQERCDAVYKAFTE